MKIWNNKVRAEKNKVQVKVMKIANYADCKAMQIAKLCRLQVMQVARQSCCQVLHHENADDQIFFNANPNFDLAAMEKQSICHLKVFLEEWLTDYRTLSHFTLSLFHLKVFLEEWLTDYFTLSLSHFTLLLFHVKVFLEEWLTDYRAKLMRKCKLLLKVQSVYDTAFFSVTRRSRSDIR